MISTWRPAPRETSEKKLTQEIQCLITELQQAEQHAKELIQTARAKRRSFGLSYSYLDEDIAHVIGRLHYMQLMTTQWEGQPALPSSPPICQRGVNRPRPHGVEDTQGIAQKAPRDDHRAS
jgi:hypothetical protein